MRLIKNYHKPEDAEAIEFGRLELTARSRDQSGNAKQSEYDQIKVYRACVGYNDDTLYLLDAVGTTGDIMALRSCMSQSVNCKLKFRSCGAVPSYVDPEKDRCGYRVFCEPIGQRVGNKQLMHYIAISNRPGFMPFVTPNALAKSLTNEVFTTPFLSPILHGPTVPDWMPYITEKLLERGTLQYLRSFNCLGGLLLPQQSSIEDIISEGVRNKDLPWVDYDIDEIVAANKDLQRIA